MKPWLVAASFAVALAARAQTAVTPEQADAFFNGRGTLTLPPPPAAPASTGRAGRGYSGLAFSKEISKLDLQRALQAMVDQTYLVGFRTFADAEDMFHAHMIFDGGDPKLKLLLFHTQERAGLYERYEPKSKYNYVDRTKRNWVLPLDTLKAQDANLYRVGYTKPEWCVGEEAFTIDFNMLDPKKLGFASGVRETVQINFYKTRCDKRENPDSRKVTIDMPDGKRVCAELYDAPPKDKYYSENFIKFGHLLARDRKNGTYRSACPDTSPD